MNILQKYAGALAMVAIVIAAGGYLYPLATADFGAMGTRFPNGVSADSTSPNVGQVRGATFTSTGTAAVGCVQTVATSTATPIRFLFNTSATTSISGTASGFVVWGFGTCPF